MTHLIDQINEHCMLLAGLSSSFGVERRVIGALVLRDMRARFGAGFLGYIVAIGLPYLHLLGLMSVPLLANQIAPLGTDYALFVATGILPYILCLYPSRMMLICLAENGPLLGFPVVKPLDVILARALQETIVAFTVTIVFVATLLAIGIEVVPSDAAEATFAILSSILFGLGVGFMGAILFKMIRAWMFVHIALLIGMYLSSGAFFLARTLPESLRYWISFNPLFHCVEWLRVAYYEGYSDDMLSREYLVGFSLGLICLGLLSERMIRGRLMEA